MCADSTHSSSEVPNPTHFPDCLYLFEFCIIESLEVKVSGRGNPFDALFSSRDAAFLGSYLPVHGIDVPVPSDDSFKIVGKNRCGKLNIVVSLEDHENPVLFVRSRVTNQDGLVSGPSPVYIFKLC
jgi:hypothetical protein